MTADDGSAVPFTMRDRTLNFFSGAPGGVKVVAGDREYLYSLTLPELWESKWTPPADVHLGVPRFTQILEASTRPVAVAGAGGRLGLLAEWMLYGRFRRGMVRAKRCRCARGEDGGAG